MATRRLQNVLLIVLASSIALPPLAAQATANPPAARPPADPALDAASAEIGRALILRCFCSTDNLRFDAQGHPLDAVHTADWTLAGVNVLKVERHSATAGEPGQIELDGVRVAIRYATDRHEFDRHPQNDEHVKILIAAPNPANPDPAAFSQTLSSIFSEGIDRSLQLSMPPLWQHYFDPTAAWSADELNGQSILTPGVKAGSGSDTVTSPVATHKAEAEYSAAANRDRVQGNVLLRMAVDATGVPHRITVVQPIGYGLDASAAAAAAKMRFTPASLDGKPVAAYVVLREDFVVVAPPGN